eukprot:CAMPEP_0172460030 /NCGR_PEP_ID=MMETSP1065-20121228/35177_1 /TAXON_ID=265537 /ORGANISM="Amphiprora paludosa, Strain CCMP125" /LENGTH=94 /DNA_ID=CAMNT_0013214923 /DNA_START=25 /DNA_END=305 /DNA_ORIENTATION=-
MRWVRVLLGVLVGLLLALVQVGANEDEEIRLGVTIRNRDMLDRAPSCLHTFSRVELVNQHNSEVIIKSIDIAPESTIRIGTDGSDLQDAIVYDS